MRVRVPPVTIGTALLVALALLATGCSGGDKKKEAGPKTTVTRYPPTIPVNNEKLSEGSGACGFVSAAEVQAAVGSAANAGTGTRTKTGESCRWTLRSNATQFVAVILNPTGAQQFDQFQTTLGAAAERLNGVGDRAFVSNDTAYAIKGPHLLILEVVTSQTLAVRKQAAIKLVMGAITRV